MRRNARRVNEARRPKVPALAPTLASHVTSARNRGSSSNVYFAQDWITDKVAESGSHWDSRQGTTIAEFAHKRHR